MQLKITSQAEAVYCMLWLAERMDWGEWLAFLEDIQENPRFKKKQK